MHHVSSPYCNECRRQIRRSDRHHRARARKFGVEYQNVIALAVYDRDAWVCALCAEPIAPAAMWPDQMCASIDHRIPMSLGGSHTYENVQAAHWLCNTLKGVDTSIDFRLAAAG